MISFLKRFFGPIRTSTSKNTPPETPPSQPQGEVENASNQGKAVQQEAFDQAMVLIQLRLDNSSLLLIGVLLVLTVCFITLFFGYWQFASTSFNDYSQKVQSLNDQRYELLLDKVEVLETGNSSIKSAQ